MTQIPSKFISKNFTNTDTSTSENIQVESQTASDDFSSSSAWQQSSPVKTPQILVPEEIEPEVQNLQTSIRQEPVRWWQRISVRAKATGLAIVIGITPVLAIGSIAYYFANQSITEQIKKEKQQRAVQLANKINVFMSDRFADIQVLGQLPIFTNSQIFQATSVEEKVALLDRYVKLYGVYNSVALFDLNGDTVVQAQGKPVPNHKTRDYYERIMKTGQPTINPPSLSRTTGTLSMHIASPVKEIGTGNITGMVRFQLPVQGLDKIAQDYSTQGDSYYVIDNAGKYFLASGSQERINKPAQEHFAKYAQLKAANQLDSVIDVNLDDGSLQLLTYAPLENLAGLEELDFGVLIASNLATAFAPQRQLLLTIALGTLLTALLVSAIATTIANRATRPLLAAADAVEKIGQGELDTQLAVQGKDELAVLGVNINNMAAQLKSFVQEQALATKQAQLLAEVNSARSLGSQALQEIFNTTVKGVRKLLKADRVLIYRFHSDSHGEVIAESVASDLPSAFDDKFQYPPISQELLNTYRKGLVVPHNDLMMADLTMEQLPLIESFAIKARIEVPILHEGQLFSLLSIHHCLAPHDWQASEIAFLQQLATQLEFSLDRVILLEQTEKLAQEQQQLKEKLQQRALELLEEVEPVGKGDLTIRANVTEDEIGTIADSYNATVENLRQIVLQVQATASQVTKTTSSNEPVVRALSKEALRQTEEIAMALNRTQEMNQSMQLVAVNAQQAQVAVQEASQIVEEGDAIMNQTVEGILEVQETISEAAKKVKLLGESSQKISAVVKLINTFAAQTNLLALNASMEAARAGEEGRGFAVVANQVRSLARQSAEASAEIKQLVAGIQAETHEVVAVMEAGTEQVATGTRLVEETRHSLNKITLTSTEISTLVEAIAQATVLQSVASESVTTTMTNVANIATKTSLEASSVSSSFEQLQAVAQLLQAEVGRFKLS
ncbi:MAG: GAF domain-containing protein [Symploca sp. SIO1A3]|nr:GAF domain-containing protein [Symploca sp. SIO1A3]